MPVLILVGGPFDGDTMTPTAGRTTRPPSPSDRREADKVVAECLRAAPDLAQTARAARKAQP